MSASLFPLDQFPSSQINTYNWFSPLSVFPVGEFLMSSISLGFWLHWLEFYMPVFVYLSCFCFLSIRQYFFKKTEVWFEVQEWYYLFPKSIYADILQAAVLGTFSIAWLPYSNSNWNYSRFSSSLWNVKSISNFLSFLRVSIQSLEYLPEPICGALSYSLVLFVSVL